MPTKIALVYDNKPLCEGFGLEHVPSIGDCIRYTSFRSERYSHKPYTEYVLEVISVTHNFEMGYNNEFVNVLICVFVKIISQTEIQR